MSSSWWRAGTWVRSIATAAAGIRSLPSTALARPPHYFLGFKSWVQKQLSPLDTLYIGNKLKIIHFIKYLH
jgi:hypothetical protein